MTFREALTGPWSRHWMFLVGSLIPATLLVLLQESATPFPTWWWPLLSAIMQHFIAGMFIFVSGTLGSRMNSGTLVVVIIALWTIAAISRALTSGFIAELVTDVDPGYSGRLLVWLLATFVWLPPMVYAIAKLERRRALLGALHLTRAELDYEESKPDDERSSHSLRLSGVVEEYLAPALRDLELRLENSRGSFEVSERLAMQAKLSQLHNHTSELLDITKTDLDSFPQGRATIGQSLNFSPRLPWLVALLTTSATISLTIFDVGRVWGSVAVLELLVSTLAGGFVLGLVPTAVGAVEHWAGHNYGQRVRVGAIILAVTTSCIVLQFGEIDPVTGHTYVLVPVMAASFVVASAMYYIVIVLPDLNIALGGELVEVRSTLATYRREAEQLENLERQRISQLMHGPVQGRIAACIMALNFHTSTETTDAEARELADAVLNHLHDAALDLARIVTHDDR